MRADEAGLGLAPLAQQDDVVAGQQGVLQLGQDGVLEAQDPVDQGLAGGDPGRRVAAQLLGDGDRLPPGRPQVAEGPGQVVGRGGDGEGSGGHGSSLCPAGAGRRLGSAGGNSASCVSTASVWNDEARPHSGPSGPSGARGLPARPLARRARETGKENGVTTVENATVTPVELGGTRGGPDVPTLRQDRWWVQPLVTRHRAHRLRRLLHVGRLREQELLRRGRHTPQPASRPSTLPA